MAFSELLTVARDTPKDPIPRLLAADWLEERGEPLRAEWIRLSCELDDDLAPLSGAARQLRTEQLNRQADLLREHEASWLEDWRSSLLDWSWRWGFLDGVTLTLDAFLDCGIQLLQQHPVQRVCIVADHERNQLDGYSIHRLTRAPAFELVRTCHIAPPKDSWEDSMMLADWLTQLAESPRASGLRRLESSAHFAPESGEELQKAWGKFCGAEPLARLEGLWLTLVNRVATVYESEPPPPPAAPSVFAYGETLANAVFARGLRELSFCDDISRRDVFALASGAFPSLERLKVATLYSVDDAMAALMHADLPKLTAFTVAHRMLGEYTRSPLVQQVRELGIVGADSWHGEEDARNAWERLLDVAPSPSHLTLSEHTPDDVVWDRIARQDWLASTRCLTMGFRSYAMEQSAGVSRALEQGAFRGMRRMEIRGLYSGPEDGANMLTRAFADAPQFEDLESLALYPFEFSESSTPAALDRFCDQVPNLRELRGVQLLDDAAITRFMASCSLEQLTHLSCSFVSLEDEPSDLDAYSVERLLRSERLHRLRSAKFEFRNLPMLAEEAMSVFQDPEVLLALHAIDLELTSDTTWTFPVEWGAVPVTVRERLGPRFRLL